MLLKGASALSDAELLAILIGSGTREETAVQLSQRILHSTENNLNELGKRSVRELAASFKGIGEAKAIAISAALELGRRRSACERVRKNVIKCSHDIFAIFYPLLCDLPHEELWIALTNSSSVAVGKSKISQGGTSGTYVDIRLIMQAAIQALATGIIICHNHPSGNRCPSVNDDNFTSQVNKAAKIMNMRLLDHIIIADNTYYSYADEQRL
ncbi:MAG: DNA repair protein RadC [Tannerellaceae bacterium]|nr:DNA repair protein RadC [Tannerellaceae bacterium]